MSRTTRIRILSRPLYDSLARPQPVMSCDVGSLYAAAAMIEAGSALTSAQAAELRAAQDVLGRSTLVTATSAMSERDRARLAASVTVLAGAVAAEQRAMIAAAVADTLKAQNWTVTVVEGGDPDRYTGIEATRATEHLVAAAGPGELIADQAGAHDCGATVDALAAGLRELGYAVAITDDVPHDGSGGSLYALAGGPTHAHAVQASLRHSTRRRGVRASRAAQPVIRPAAGDR